MGITNQVDGSIREIKGSSIERQEWLENHCKCCSEDNHCMLQIDAEQGKYIITWVSLLTAFAGGLCVKNTQQISET